MFQGESAITIDDKGRLAVPTAHRELVARECGNRLVITYNPFESGSLWIYPHHVWERVRDQVNALPKVKKVNRALQLKLVGAADLDLPGARDGEAEPLPINLRAAREVADRRAIRQALTRTENNISGAAKLLGISRPTLYDLMKQYHLQT